MSQTAQDVLNDVIAPATTPRKFDWMVVRAALAEVAVDRSQGAVDLMVNILKFDGDVGLRPGALPQALSPTEMMHAMAIQALAGLRVTASDEAIRRVLATTNSELVAQMASYALNGHPI